MTKYAEVIQKHMGGTFSVKFWPKSEEEKKQGRKLIETAFLEVKRLEDLLTDFRPSPFNEINVYAGVQPVRVDAEIFQLIQAALKISAQSQGAFDISYASVGHLYREARKTNRPPDLNQIKHAQHFVDYRNIEINAQNQTVYLPHKLMRIGLGGIGKGYAVDRLYLKLVAAGLENFYVNGAGDIRVHSRANAPRAWRVGIRNPFAKNPNTYIGFLQIKTGAVATSGNYINFIPSLGTQFHHIIDPKTGLPSQEVASVTIIADEAMLADTSATIVMIKGMQAGKEWLDTNGLSGFLISTQGKVLHSQKSLQAMERYGKHLQKEMHA